jgi:hypothetical protein
LKVAQAFIHSARKIKEPTMMDRFFIIEYDLFML